MRTPYVDEGSVVALPSLSNQCWLRVELHRKSSQDIKFMCPNSPAPSAAHLSPSESFQGKVSDQQPPPVGPIQHPVVCLGLCWNKTGSFIFKWGRGGELGSYSFVL